MTEQHPIPTQPVYLEWADLPWWRKIIHTEPAVVRGLVTAIVSLGLIWGVDLTAVGEQVTQTADVLGSLVILLGGWWTRNATTATIKVVEYVEDDALVHAGRANEILPTGQVIRRLGEAPTAAPPPQS